MKETLLKRNFVNDEPRGGTLRCFFLTNYYFYAMTPYSECERRECAFHALKVGNLVAVAVEIALVARDWHDKGFFVAVGHDGHLAGEWQGGRQERA
jgi:hypothetical protein